MVKKLINNFVAADGTTLSSAFAGWVQASDQLSTGQNQFPSVIYSNTLRRPTTGSGSQRVDFSNASLGTSTPNNYEVTVDFTFVGSSNALLSVGVIGRYRETGGQGTPEAILFRYRNNTGYQIIGLRNAGVSIFTLTSTQDLNVVASIGSPMRRRIRGRCQGNIASLFVDSYINGYWVKSVSPLLTRDISGDGGYTAGSPGMWFFSEPNAVPTHSVGYAFNEWYAEDLETGTQVPTVDSPPVASVASGAAFNYQVTGTNYPTSYAATGLPSGLSINTTTGLITGSTTVSGLTNITLTATNANGTSANFNLALTVAAVPSITSASTATVTSGAAFSYQITATNSPTSYAATGLPTGLSLNTTTGLITGSTTVLGLTNATLTATNGIGTSANFTLGITVSVSAPVITSANTATGTTGSAFNYQITATNSPTSYAATGLPSGLGINTTTGLITGTPSATGTTGVTLTATNGGGTSANFTLTITISAVPAITSASTATATSGVAFNYQITATNSPTSYAATGLPSGLSLNTTTGLITGSTTVLGLTNVTLTATNAGGISSNFTLGITVYAIPVITSANTATANSGSAFNYQITATNSPTSYAATGLPSGLSINTTTGLITGSTTVLGLTNATLTASNPAGTSTNFTLGITISAPIPVITSANTATATSGVAFNYQITATNSPTSYAATGLPSGLSLNTTTGLITGSTTVLGLATVTLTATNGGGTSANFTLGLNVTSTQTIPDPPTSLGIRVFTPLRSDAPLNLAYYTYSDPIADKVHLQWTTPVYIGTSAITGYKIEQSTNNVDWTNVITNTGSVSTRYFNLPKTPGVTYYRVSAINASGISNPSNVYTSPLSTSTVDGKLIQENGVWTFFTHPRSVNFNGNTYTGWINNAGVAGITKTNNSTYASTKFDLEDLSAVTTQFGGAEIDDHDNAAVYVTPGGRLVCFYGAHNDPGGVRSRVSEYPEDITTWSTRVLFSPVNVGVTLPTCYSNPRYIKDCGQMMYHFRTGTPPNAPHAVFYTDEADNLKSSATFKPAIPLIQSTQTPWSNQRPYVQSVVNGLNRVDFITTDGHPADSGTAENGNGTSIYHFYAQWHVPTKTIKYYRSNGVEITSLPIRPKISGGGTDATVVWAGETIRSWTWDICIVGGNPWVLFTTYDNGSNGFGFTNQRYRFGRWTGSAWVTTDITGTNVASSGTSIRGVAISAPGMGQLNVNGFPGDEPAYTGGICFDSQDPTIVYLSNPVLQTTSNNSALSVNDPFPIREIQEWRTYNNGATWAKTRDITRNTPPNIMNLRPYSPKNHDGRIAVVWCRGAYGGWVRTFNTNLYAASRVNSAIAPIGSGIALSRTGQIIPFAF
jgi:hypothetical protein